VLTNGRDEQCDTADQELGAFRGAIYRALAARRFSTLRKFVRSLQNCSLCQLASAVGGLGLLIVLGGLLVALARYAAEEVDPFSLPWWNRFLSVFLPAHLSQVPGWLVLSLIGTGALLRVAKRLWRPLVAGPAPTPLDRTLAETLRVDRGLTIHLRELVEGRAGIVLLVDDAYGLDRSDRDVLRQLFDPSVAESCFEGLAQALPLLVITLDTEQTDWDLPSDECGETVALDVPPFSETEWRRLVEAADLPQTPTGQVSVSPDAGVKVLAQRSFGKLQETVSDEYKKAKRDACSKSFGLPHMLAYWAASGSAFVRRSDLETWLRQLESERTRGLLGLAQLSTGSMKRLVKRFADTSIVRRDGKTYYFDPAACGALRNWLRSHDREALVRAHFLRFRCLAREALPTPVASATAEALPFGPPLMSAAQQLRRACDLVDVGPRIVADSPLAKEEKQACYAEAVAVLFGAARVSYDAGEAVNGDDDIVEALEWVGNLRDTEQLAWAKSAGLGLWRSYWLTGRDATRRHIDMLAETFSQLIDLPEWCAQRSFSALLQGSAEPPPFPAGITLDAPETVNLRGLERALWAARRKHGFVEDALADEEFAPDTAVDGPVEGLWEWPLRSLCCRTLFRRGDVGGAKAALSDWHRRLKEGAQGKDQERPIGIKAVRCLQTARFLHVLLEGLDVEQAAHRSSDHVQGQKPAESSVEEMARDTLSLLSPTTCSPDLAESLFDESLRWYKRAFDLCLLLQYRALLADVAFEMGTLVRVFTPGSRREADSQWWRAWEGPFLTCVELEQELNRVFHTPSVHRDRWQFFERFDRPTSIDDAWRAYDALRHANFPTPVVVQWHDDVQTLINNYGDSSEDFRRSAQLHETWARELAVLPEATPLRRFPESVQCEQATALTFAAQAWRRLGDYDRAEQLLVEARRLLNQTRLGADVPEEARGRQRTLDVRIAVQSAWLQLARGAGEDYRRAIREIWSRVCPGEPESADVFLELVTIEHDQGLLDGTWPPQPGLPEGEDPANPFAFLPAEMPWAEAGTSVSTRFEFRVHQFVRLLAPNPLSRRRDLEPALLLACEVRNSKFAEIGLFLAELHVEHGYGEPLGQVFLDMLKIIRLFYQEIAPDDTREMDALRLLSHTVPDNARYRERYRRVLLELQDLQRRELWIQESEGRMDWFRTAVEVSRSLDLLVDKELTVRLVEAALGAKGHSFSEFHAARDQRVPVLKQARKALASRDFDECARLLNRVLPTADVVWVTVEDLEVLDLWCRCRRLAGAPAGNEENARAADLRALTLRFVAQIGRSISDQEVRALALGVLETLRARSPE
jgi:tetratricopeptide (TPR) repeat protein